MLTGKRSTFFTNQREQFPSPSEILEKSNKEGRTRVQRNPPPVKFPSLGLIVKFGQDIKRTEAETQMMIYNKLRGRVPVPEVFGWTEEQGHVFIYMSLVEGDTLHERWRTMNEEEKKAICGELKCMVDAWQALKQDGDVPYVGSLGATQLNEVELEKYSMGPYHGPDAIKQFNAMFDINHSTEIVFTHNDLVPVNILVTKEPKPRVAAIMDWEQSGWYPAYWEHCKARIVGVFKESAHDKDEWRYSYLPTVLDPVDEDCRKRWANRYLFM